MWGDVRGSSGQEGRRSRGPWGCPAQRAQAQKLIPGPGVLSPCLHPLPPRPGARQGQVAPRDPAPHRGRSDRWGPSRPVGEEGRRRDPQTLSPWRPLETQQLPGPPQRLPGTPHSLGPLSLPLLQVDPAVPGALGGQWVPQILPNLAHQGTHTHVQGAGEVIYLFIFAVLGPHCSAGVSLVAGSRLAGCRAHPQQLWPPGSLALLLVESSQIGDQTCVSCIGGRDSSPPSHQGSPSF